MRTFDQRKRMAKNKRTRAGGHLLEYPNHGDGTLSEGRTTLAASEILKRIRVPSHIMNNSIAHLCEIGFIVPVKGKAAHDERDRRHLQENG